MKSLSPEPSTTFRARAARHPLALATLLAATLALTACTPTEDPRSAESTQSQTQQQSIETLDLVLEDEALGHVFQIHGIVRHFPNPDDPTESMGEFILINLTATTGTEYSSTWGPGDTRLQDSSGDLNQPLMATQTLAAMDAAGFTPLEGDPMQPGETATGWIPYRISNAGSMSLDFTTKHLAAKVMNGTNIDAEEYSISLTD